MRSYAKQNSLIMCYKHTSNDLTRSISSEENLDSQHGNHDGIQRRQINVADTPANYSLIDTNDESKLDDEMNVELDPEERIKDSKSPESVIIDITDGSGGEMQQLYPLYDANFPSDLKNFKDVRRYVVMRFENGLIFNDKYYSNCEDVILNLLALIRSMKVSDKERDELTVQLLGDKIEHLDRIFGKKLHEFRCIYSIIAIENGQF